MKLRMQTSELAKALYRIQGIVDKKSTMPILSHVMLRAAPDGLTVQATDLDVGLSGTYDAEVLQPGQLAVQARQMHDIVKSISTAKVEIERQDNDWLEIRAGSSKFHLVGMSAEEFPQMPEYSDIPCVALPAKALLKMIERTLFCVSSDENRHNLSGIFCETPEPHTLRMVATDGHRLALAEKNFSAPIKLAQGALVPRKGFQELKRVLADTSAQDAEVEIGFSASNGVLKAGGVVLSTRLIEGLFPDYSQVIPQESSKQATIGRAAFAEALRRVSLLSQGRAHGVRFGFSAESLQLLAEDPESGNAEETLPIQYEGAPLDIGFNARYILDVLNLTTESNITFQLADDLSPGVLRPMDDARFLAVVMPMRI